MTTVVTGFSPEGFEQYGRRAVEAFLLHWPRDVRLVAYVEEPTGIGWRRYEERSLASVKPCRAFLDRHADNAEAHGRGRPRRGWRSKEIGDGYSYRFDAFKFCRMVFFAWHAALEISKRCELAGEETTMAWMDGDVITNKAVPSGFLDDLLGNAVCAYLGRGSAHSEIGFVAYRLPQAMPLLDAWAEFYATDRVFDLLQWHSAFVFDHARKEAEAAGLKCRDLTPGGRGHVWFQSPLGEYMDHLKGEKRKRRGGSGATWIKGRKR